MPLVTKRCTNLYQSYLEIFDKFIVDIFFPFSLLLASVYIVIFFNTSQELKIGHKNIYQS